MDHREARGCPPHCSHRVSPVWFPPYQDADGRVETARRLIREAEKGKTVADRVKRRGAVNANSRTVRALNLLIRAHECLDGARDAFEATLVIYTTEPEPVFPFLLIGLSDRIEETQQEIDAVFALLREAFHEIDDLAEHGVGPVPKVEPAPRPRPPERQLICRPPRPTDRIEALFKRRQRWRSAAPEDAPRRLSRGRAPPSLSDCSL